MDRTRARETLRALARARLPDLDRRLRDRLLVARVPAHVPGRRGQDRQVVRGRSRQSRHAARSRSSRRSWRWPTRSASRRRPKGSRRRTRPSGSRHSRWTRRRATCSPGRPRPRDPRRGGPAASAATGAATGNDRVGLIRFDLSGRSCASASVAASRQSASRARPRDRSRAGRGRDRAAVDLHAARHRGRVAARREPAQPARAHRRARGAFAAARARARGAGRCRRWPRSGCASRASCTTSSRTR